MATASIATAAARGGVSVGVQQQQQQPTISKDVYKRIAEGRRVPREACPTNPTLRDIVETAAKLGLRMVVEVNKRHPRDPFTLGRVRVELKKEDGSLAGPIKSRDHLLLTIALALRNAQFEAAAANAGSAAGSAASSDPTSPQPVAASSATASPASGSKQKKRK